MTFGLKANKTITDCIAECPNATYTDSKTRLCVDCSPNCTRCTQTGCTVCESNFFLFFGACRSDCPAEYC